MLCIDTCGPSLLLGFGAAASSVAVHYEPMATGQAEAIIPALDALLDRPRCTDGTAPRVDRIAVTVGPGSFTGLRVGLAVAKARAVADGADLLAVNRLQMLARCARLSGASYSGYVVSVDARRGERFMQAFDAQLAPLTQAMAIPNGDVDAWRLDQDVTHKAFGYITGHEAFDPALQASALFEAGQAAQSVSHSAIRPLYVRAPDAKRPKETRFTVS